MKEGVLLSWLAVDHDPFYSEMKRGAILAPCDGALPGPSLQLVNDSDWGSKFGRYVVFHQKAHAVQAAALQKAIADTRQDLEVELVDAGDLDPIDHAAIFARLSPLVQDIVRKFPYDLTMQPGDPLFDYAFQHHYKWSEWPILNLRVWGDVASSAPKEVLDAHAKTCLGHEYFINISQGTPAMHAIWLILVQAGILRARPIQTRPERFRKMGESVGREVSLDVGKLPMPTMRNLEIRFVRDYRERRSLGPIAVLSDFVSAREHREDNSYGLYRITHSPASEMWVGETIHRIAEDVRDVEEFLSDSARSRLRGYIAEAEGAFRSGYEAYKAWFNSSAEERSELKKLFRFCFRSWQAEIRDRFASRLEIEAEWNENAEVLSDIHCEAEVVRRGLDAIVENAAEHAYPAGARGKMQLTIERGRSNLTIVLADFGKGIPNLAGRFRRSAEATGNGMSDVKQLARWFDIEAVSTTSLAYSFRCDKERTVDASPGTGTRYTLACQLAPTLASEPS